MATFLLVLHLFIAIGLVSVVLLQRSEGGALGMGGGGPGGVMSGRAAGDLLTRVTQILAVAFFASSIFLVVVHSVSSGDSVVDTNDIDAERQIDDTPLFDDDLLEGLTSPEAEEPVTFEPGFDLEDEFAVTPPDTGEDDAAPAENAGETTGEEGEPSDDDAPAPDDGR